jgi:hypothetical protein
MNTTTETDQETRAEKIERFVHREALTIFLDNLLSVVPADQRSEEHPLAIENEVVEMPSDGLHDELWPDAGEASSPSQEHAYASLRAELVASQMFAELAANADKCRELGIYFTALAENHAAELQGRIQLRSKVDDYVDPRVSDLVRQLDEHGS